jgi:hypothetical protein
VKKLLTVWWQDHLTAHNLQEGGLTMARRSISIEEKIQQQKEVVSKAKDKYEASLEELEKLMKKRDEIRNKEILDAIATSSKSYDEIMAFLRKE